MKIKQISRYFIISSFAALTFTACSEGDSTESVINKNGYLKDSNLAGITYTCGETTGITDAEGKFSYLSNCSPITFTIGNLTLGSLNPAEINSKDNTLYPADLLGLDRTNTSDEKLTNMLQVLQSLDSDGNPNNGIEITEETTTLLEGISPSNLSSETLTNTALTTIVSSANKSLIEKNAAIAHYEDTLRQDLNSEVDTVAPAIAIRVDSLEKTKEDSVNITINGEIGAKVFVDGSDSSVVIDENHSATLTLNTAGEDGTKSFDIKLEDALEQMSESLTVQIEKDATAPQFTLSTLSVDENSTANIVDIDPIEENGVTYSLTGTDASSFQINTDGVLTINTPADYETKNSYELNIVATDDLGNTVTKAANVAVNHLNDETPVITTENNVSFNENSTSSLTTLSISDADLDETQTFTYSISGTDANDFNINTNTGEISFKSAPDYETKNSYTFSATVNDGLNTSEEKEIIVSINPQNDIAPILTTESVLSIDENSESSLVILTSSDADVDQIQTFTYSLSGTDADDFNIDSSTGEISFKSAPDYETKKSYSFDAKVNDGINDSEVKTFTVNINHLNDETPIITSLDAYSIDENSTSAVTTITSNDADIDETQTFTYSISGTDANYFNIDSSTGALSLKDAPDYEMKQSYSVNVAVNDGINTSEAKAITLTVNHLNDETPVIANINSLSIDEGSNTELTITSTDADIDETQTFTYTLGGTDVNLFNFNTSTGVLTFKDTPDYENPNDSDKNNVYNLTIQVSDGLNSSAVSSIEVNLNNIDDVPTPTEFAGTVSGIVNTGSAVANATVVLQDKNQQLIDTTTDSDGRYTLTLDNSYQGPFVLKAILPTGQILYSFNEGNKAVSNITPLTSLIISNFVVNLDTTMYGLFADFNTLYANNSEFNTLLTNSYNEVNAYFSDYLANNLLTGFNHFYNSFSTYGFDYDKILDNLDMAVTSDVVIVRHENNVYSTIPNITLENIDITGRILDSTGSAIEGANIIAEYANNVLNATTDSTGRYTFNLPNYTNVDLTVSNDGRDINYFGLSTFFSNSNYAQQVDTIQYSTDNTSVSTISGFVYNGRTSSTRVPDVTLNVREGYNNKTGDILETLTADSSGNYTIDLTNGNYTFEFSKNQWTTEYYNILVSGDLTSQNYFINEFGSNYLAPNALVTAVLRWADRPRDLDTHLTGPIEDSTSRFHTYYSSKVQGTYPSDSLSPCETSGTIATLDVDDTSGYGPETLSLCKRVSGTYHYYIYNYSGYPEFDVSNANVRVSTASGFNYTFNVPYESGNTYRYWHVFDIDEYGNIVPINTLKSSGSGLQ